MSQTVHINSNQWQIAIAHRIDGDCFLWAKAIGSVLSSIHLARGFYSENL